MNLHIKVVRVFKFIVKYKLFVMFLCYVVSMCYLLENKNNTTEPTVNQKGHVPLQNYINEKTVIQRVEYKDGKRVPPIRAANVDKSRRSKTITNLPLYKTYTSTFKSSGNFQTPTTNGQTKPHTNKTMKDNMKADKALKFKNSTFQRITNNTRKVSSMPSPRSLLHDTTYSKTGPPVPLFQEWLDTGEFHCEKESELEGYPKFMRIKNITIDRKFGSSPPGGERVSDVMRQKESMEFVKMRPGFFEITCEDPVPFYFWGNHHMQNWFINIVNTPNFLLKPVQQTVEEFTLAVVRIEYANFYHLVQDLYGAFLMMEFFERPQSQTNIILIEGHPWTSLDLVWLDFFNSTRRLSNLPQRTMFKELVWSIGGHDNPMSDFMDSHLPLGEEFRDFVLTTYKISPNTHVLDCTKIRILLLWRHNYIAHARNPSGVIKRKFANEQEIFETVQQNFINATVQGIQIDLLNMSTQLKTVSSTDILIGMLGAGLTHAMFLPKSGGLIELRPEYYKEISQHFESIAKWRKLKYIRWTNKDIRNEVGSYETRIPPMIIIKLIKQMIHRICPNKQP